jgi:threonine dehydrogenase-like Zn-dependent dehydrogenase
MRQALGSIRPGGHLGFVGVPAGAPELPMQVLFNTNVRVAGGMATVRPYIDELLPDVLSGTIEPGRVFDLTLPLDQVSDAYSMKARSIRYVESDEPGVVSSKPETTARAPPRR